MTTPADLERVAKWLGDGYRLHIPSGEWMRKQFFLGGHEWVQCSDWDVTGAIFDAFVRDGVEVGLGSDEQGQQKQEAWVYLHGSGYAGICDDDIHAAALACAVKYLEDKP